MKKLFAAALALSAFAAPAQASPIWATATAKSACKYMASGVSFDQSMRAAINDNNHWSSEMNRANKLGVFGTAVRIALNEQCPAIVKRVHSQKAQGAAHQESPEVKAITRVGNLITESQNLMVKGDMKQACAKATEADKLQKAYSLGTSRPLEYALTSCVQA